MFGRLADLLFGCWHGNYSFPITIKPGRRSLGWAPAGTYVVCLDCGCELAYDWTQMRVGTARLGRASSGLKESKPPVVPPLRLSPGIE